MKADAKRLRPALGWQLAFEAAAAPIVLLDSRQRIRRINHAAKELFEFPTATVLGKTLDEFGEGEPWKTGADLARQLLGGSPGVSTHVITRSANRTWNITIIPVTRRESSLACLLCAWEVGGERPQEVFENNPIAHKLSALTAGIAHQVKNPLFAISATMDAFETRFSSAEEQRHYFTVIRDSVHRLNELTQQLIDYADPAPLAMQLFDLDAVIDQAIQTCRPLAQRLKVRVVHERNSGLPRLLMDPHRMQDVLRYLLEYALYRSLWNGRVSVRATQSASSDRSFVECVVEDCGKCIPDQDLQSVWEPFFKHEQAGAGLGLAIASLTMQQHGAQVLAENRSDAAGVRFILRIPSRRLSES